MDKKINAVYEPGELDRVRGKLGSIDESEAKRMAKILGGEVGVEKQPGKVKRETVELALPGRKRRRPGRIVELASDDKDSLKLTSLGSSKNISNPADDPSVILKTTYLERIKMDRYAAQLEFEIKTSMQALVSMFSFLSEPVDYVNPRFVNRRISTYYSKVEQLVTSTRSLFPRHDARRSERLKKSSPFVYTVLDTIRHWNIERIGADLAKVQAHPRSAKVSEWADILRAIYKPLFILEKLDMDTHIKGSYKLLYKLLYVENPAEPKGKNQELIRLALTSFASVRREVHYGLYPLLMKLISDRWFPYERLFLERHNRFMAFLGVTEEDQIKPSSMNPEQVENGNLEAIREDIKKEEEEKNQAEKEEDPDNPEVIARKARAAAAEAEQKAVDRSMNILETLFPQAGWEKMPNYPGFYPYFASVYGLRHGYELIAPYDPLLPTAVLMHIMENICAALRYVSFGTVSGADGQLVHLEDVIGIPVTNWRRYLDDSFKEYLTRLSDYCRMLEHSPDAKNSMYARRTLNEIRWTRRLYFLPYYKFESLGPPPFQNQDTTAIYSVVRNLRKNLTLVAAGIEQGNHNGGAEAKAVCNGIDNPWAPYHFEIPNPVSKRLDALLGPGKRNNAALIFFALSATSVLDNLVNTESSWAYADNSKVVFRSVKDEGAVPMFGVDIKIDADQIFKNSLKRKA